MAEIDGGALSFKSVMDNDQMNAAINETLRRVQGLSDGTVAGGKKMDAAFDETADNIRNALGQIGTACEMHEKELQNLESEYQRLGQKSSAAIMAGRDEEYSAITNQQKAIKGEITVRERLLQELRDQSNELEIVAQKQDESRQKTEENANAQISMRSRIKSLREEMMLLVDQGIDEQSEAYQRLKGELGRLIDIQSDVAQQGRTLANDEQKFAGVMSGLSGLAGGFSAATGAVGLFAGENEDLNKVMTKVQSVMAITMGIQQVAETLNKDSAFQLVTMNSLKEWWRNVVVQSTVAETAETVATAANTAAQEANATATAANTAGEVTNAVATGAQATAATAGTVANIGLAGAFRLVGAAISSIPVFGWIAAGLTILVTAIVALTSKQREAKKEQEEFTKAVVDGSYKAIGSVQFLSQQWKALGNDMDAKKKFIEQNKKAFDELGISILDVADAERLLNSNTGTFIAAQIAKAKAAVLLKNAEDVVKQSLEAEQEVKEAKKTPKIRRTETGMGGVSKSYYEDNPAIQKAKEKQKDANDKLRNLYAQAAVYEKDGAELMKNVGIGAIKKYSAGTIGAIEQAIDAKKKALEGLKGDNKAYLKTTQDIEKLQKKLDKLKGQNTTNTTNTTNNKDPFLEKLEKQKAEYTRFLKWMNSGDAIIAKAANKEFAGLLKEGATYMDYLKMQRDQIMTTPESKRTSGQQKKLDTLNNQIADETQKTTLDLFNTQVDESLKWADNIFDKLQKIADMRKGLNNDGTELDNSKKEKLDNAEKNVIEEQKEETYKLLDDYSSYLDKKIKLEVAYNNDMLLLEKARASATTDAERSKIQRTIDNRTKKFKKDSKSSGDEDYDAMLETFKTFEQKRQAIIDEYAEKRKVAQAHGDSTLDNKLLKEQSKALLQNSFEELKGSPDYIRAFEDLKNTSSETLNTLLAKFDEVKGAAAGSLNPEDLREYTATMTNIVNELNERDPFTAIKNGYTELRAASKELSNAQLQLNQIRNNGGTGTDKEKAAIDRVNKAKDTYIKKNNQVKQSEKVASNAVKELCDNLSSVGDAVGGEAGQIISLIGNVGSFTMSAIQGFETASEASSIAIQTVEKASVILTIISAAMQVVTKIASIFAGDDGTAAYENAEKAYKNYISILDDVIDKQKELIASMTGENATNSYKYAMQLISKQGEAARELGKQYLNAGASKGVLGIGSKASHGVDQRKNISSEGMEQFNNVAALAGIDKKVADGRMTGLFDLTAEQLTNLRENAPIFWAQLHDDTRTYLEQIIKCTEQSEKMKDTMNESITGITFDSLSGDFLDTLSDMDSNAETFSKNFGEYMRKALIQNMYKAQFKEQLQKWYQMWSDSMNSDGDGGITITANEQAALDTIKNSIITGATDAAKKINEQFKSNGSEDESLTGAVKGVSEETASLVGGQMNAMRINQLEATSILRQQLVTLSAIAYNTSYNYHLAKLERIVTLMESQAGKSLRSQGL